MRGAGEEGLSVSSQMSRRALLTGAFRSDSDEDGEPGTPARVRRSQRGDSGAPASAEQREALDDVLDQMNGPTGFEDLEARES